MGIGFVFLIWAAVGIVLSGAGAPIFGLAAAYLTRGALNGRKGWFWQPLCSRWFA